MSDKPVSKKSQKTARKSSGRDASKRIEDYKHADKTRVNLPTEELAEKAAGGGQEEVPETRFYDFPRHDDLYLDPHLSWARKTDKPNVEVDVQSLHEHERIEPATIIEAIRKYKGSDHGEKQERLFGKEEYNLPSQEALEFYQHQRQWSNRLIVGDSLLVMNSMIQREALGGAVQMVYMDPPYGVKFGSNFQPFADSSVSEKGGGSEELTSEVQTLKAYRDTWELGIHSYLTYLRDRLLVARELLTGSGSCFVQIGDENVHRVAILMDEIFGAENRIATISYVTTGSSAAKTISEVADYILWYAKDKKQVKFKQLYEPLTRQEIIKHFNWHVMVENPDGTTREIEDIERFDPDKELPEGARVFRRMPIYSQKGGGSEERTKPFLLNGRKHSCPENSQWRVSHKGLKKLAKLNRLDVLRGKNSYLAWKLYEDEVPGRKIHNIWARQMSATHKKYVVETAPKIIERCILMTTDEGDLVVDPTCGSGTTAYVAEKWGRRWVTADTSRVSVVLARHRLMTAVFDNYELINNEIGVGGGFVYNPITTVSAGSLANDEQADEICLYDNPVIKNRNGRVTGPFTVEAVPSPVVDSIDDVTDNKKINTYRSGKRKSLHIEWLNEIKHAGVQVKANQKIQFSELKSESGRYIHGKGKTSDGKNVLVSFGPEYAALSSQQVKAAIDEGDDVKPRPDYILFAAFAFDEKAKRSIDDYDSGVTLLSVRIDTDLQTKDLKKKQRAAQSFWLIGKPEVKVVSETDDAYKVELCGFDYFDVHTGRLESGSTKNIVMWMLDPDYDGRSLYPRQVFFPMKNSKLTWKKLEKNLGGKIDKEKAKIYEKTKSLIIYAGVHRQIAVKVITDDGVESMTVRSLPVLQPRQEIKQ